MDSRGSIRLKIAVKIIFDDTLRRSLVNFIHNHDYTVETIQI
jgi:hypothetical protein